MTWAVAALGLFVGWIAGLIAYRVPREKSIVNPPSTCPHCDTLIRPADIIPVVSWLVLRGRCRNCREPISLRYPIVELATAALFALTAYRIGFNWLLPAYLAFALVTMVLVLTDLDWKRIPNAILFPGGGVAVILLTVGAFLEDSQAHLGRAAAGGVLFFGILLLMAIMTKGGMGMGDVKLAALLGVFTAFLSWAVFMGGIIIGFMTGGLIGLILLITGRKGRKDEVPFGPPLMFGSWLAILCEPLMATWLPLFSQ